MSLVTQLVKGQIDPAVFITRAAADLANDAKIFSSLPGIKPIENWALGVLAARLEAGGLSVTVTDLIVDSIRKELGLVAPTPPQSGS